MSEYPWYEISSGEVLSQGDFFDNCPVVIPSTDAPMDNGQDVIASVVEYDVVVMSQSCDLKYKKVDLVLVCPFWTFTAFRRKNTFYNSTKGKMAFKEGYAPGYHLLMKCGIEGFETDHLVVDFRNAYGVPFAFLTKLAKDKGPRLRLLPPYKEHLSQAFARFFMRVGLPVPIPDLG